MSTQDDRSDVEARKANAEDIEVKESNVESAAADTQTDDQAELSRKAAAMGEARKRSAETLLSLAEKNVEAKNQLQELITDESEKAYYEKKFGDRFSSLFSNEEQPEDKEKQVLNEIIREREVAQKSQLDGAKRSLGLTLDQADKFDALVKTLNGANLGDGALTLKQAMEMAARQLRPDSPLSFNSRGDVLRRPEDSKEEVKIPVSAEAMRKNARYTEAKSADDYKHIAEAVQKTGAYTPKLF